MKQKIMFLIIGVLGVLSTHAQNYLYDSQLKTTESGLKYKIVKQGTGKTAQSGDRVWVHFVGKLPNDSIFDSTFETGEIDVFLGQGQLIKAWEEGLPLVQEGGEIVLVVPPDLGYGDYSYKGTPPNSTLVFEISVLQIDKGTPIKPFNTEGLTRLKSKDKISYYILNQGSGSFAIPGENAFVHYTAFLSDGTIFDSSQKKGKPVRITVGSDQVFKGWDLSIQLMKVGGKCRFVIPSDLAFGKEGYKNMVPPNETITLDMELVRLTPEIKVAKWDAQNRDTLSTASGLKYIVFEAGQGDSIQYDNLVEVHYSGYFADGTLFDSSVKRDEPIKFPVGVGIVIDGWDEGARLMKKGARFQFIIPPHLAYGDAGAPPQIPVNATLIFDIEVLSVVK